MKRSPWFRGTLKPAEVGVYERMGSGWFSRWNGREWFFGAWTVKEASRSNAKTLSHDEPWRGLASKPKAKP